MPQIKSAIKRVKVTKVKNLNNRMNKNALRSEVKKFEAANDASLLDATFSALDKAATKGIIHKNAANRKKARLAKRLAKAAQ